MERARKVTSKGFSSEKNFLRKTVYNAQKNPEPKASKFPIIASNDISTKASRFSSKMTRNKPTTEISIPIM